MPNKILRSIFSLTLILTISGCAVNQPASQSANQKASPAVSKSESINGSIEDLLKLGRSIKCDLAKASTDIISGTAYISGKRARSDFQMSGGADKTIAGHFIMDGTNMYSWTEGNKTPAMKISLADMEKLGAGAGAKNEGASNYSDKMDYHCTNWTVDNSLFVPPTNVKFQDFAQMMNSVTKNLPVKMPNTQSFCATCDKMPNAATIAQCKQSLGCK